MLHDLEAHGNFDLAWGLVGGFLSLVKSRFTKAPKLDRMSVSGPLVITGTKFGGDAPFSMKASQVDGICLIQACEFEGHLSFQETSFGSDFIFGASL